MNNLKYSVFSYIFATKSTLQTHFTHPIQRDRYVLKTKFTDVFYRQNPIVYKSSTTLSDVQKLDHITSVL